MIKETAIVICNWNKKEDLLLCIESVLKSTYQDFDLYVVDNASTDGSVDAIQKRYTKNEVNLIINKENLGGSGGFNTGIKYVLSLGYKYVQLLDNDVVIDKDAILEAYLYMEEHDDVGAVGSEIYLQSKPTQLYEFASIIDWEKFNINILPSPDLNNDIKECDYIPACFAFIRTEAIRKVGLMEEDCFIYWDDIEWFYRMKMNGYKIVACSKSKVWHKTGSSIIINTFSIYYYWRNRINFFLRYMEADQLESFTSEIVKEMGQAIFMSNFNSKPSIAKTIMFALEDALNNIRGRAKEKRIFEREQGIKRLEEYFQDHKKVLFISNGEEKLLRTLLKQLNKKIEIFMLINDELSSKLKEEFQINIIDQVNSTYMQVQLGSHVVNMKEEQGVSLYIDNFQHVITNKSFGEFKQNYEQWNQSLNSNYYPVLLQRFKEWRETNSHMLKRIGY